MNLLKCARCHSEMLEEFYSKMFDCSALIEKLKSNFNWSDFESYIYENENCK